MHFCIEFEINYVRRPSSDTHPIPIGSNSTF